jgi:hypothetical protein
LGLVVVSTKHSLLILRSAAIHSERRPETTECHAQSRSYFAETIEESKPLFLIPFPHLSSFEKACCEAIGNIPSSRRFKKRRRLIQPHSVCTHVLIRLGRAKGIQRLPDHDREPGGYGEEQMYNPPRLKRVSGLA